MKRIQVASKGRRIVASLIDLAIIGVLFAISYFFIFYKAVSSVQNFNYHNNVIFTERSNTHLYSSDGKKTILEENPNISYDELDSKIKSYYTEYLLPKYKEQKKPGDGDVTYTKYWYGVVILHMPDVNNKIEGETEYSEDKRLYTWDNPIDPFSNPSYKRSSVGSDDDVLSFQKSNLGTAIYNLNLSDLTPIRASTRVISFGTVRALLYSSIFSTFIPCFIIPISLKNGKTIGKLVMHLIVLTDEGYEYKRYKHIFRYLSFYVVEVFGGVLTIGITFILSTCLVLFSKKHRALHDYISFSCVADERHTVFYIDEEEENKYKNKDITELRLE